MASTPIKKAVTKKTILPDPGRVFYRPAVDDALKRGELSAISGFTDGAGDL